MANPPPYCIGSTFPVRSLSSSALVYLMHHCKPMHNSGVGGSLVGSQPRATLKIKTHKTIKLSCANVRRLRKNAEAL